MNVKEYLKDNILLFDGAMGTYLADITGDSAAICEMANIDNPTLIKDIHKRYIAAGAKAIKTNTFSANKSSLSVSQKKLREILTKGFEIAMSCGNDAFVFADIGPISSSKDNHVYDQYIEIVDVFINCGAKNFLFETFPTNDYLIKIAEYIKSRVTDAFVLVEFAIAPEGFTRMGIPGAKLFVETGESPFIDACGFNCVSGPGHLLDYIKEMDTKGKVLSVMPNAGYPTIINNRTFFGNSSDYFAQKLVDIVKNGALIVGGCCGTTPQYIEKSAKALAGVKQMPSIANIKIKPLTIKPAFDNLFEQKLITGKKVIAVELDPPLNTDIDFFIESAEKLKTSGIDAITIADCPIARASVDSSMLAVKLKSELGITPIPHMTCRDRNINATKALLLGLNIGNVANVLVVTGDPVPSAKKNEVKAMFSYNSANLAGYITALNESAFTRPFFINAALNINAGNFESQIRHAQKKIENGVSALFTQPALSEMAIENLKIAKQNLNTKIIGGILPVVSYKNACFMNNEVSGIYVSDEICKMYEKATKEEATKLAIDISTDMAQKMAEIVDGYYLITPFKRIDIICAIVEHIKTIINP